MPVTAKLSRRFYEQLGDDVANELVDWFNTVDSSYKADLRELDDRNWERFRAEMRAQFAEFGMEMDRRFSTRDTKIADLRAELNVKIADLRAELVKWMFLFWAGTVLPLAALILSTAGD